MTIIIYSHIGQKVDIIDPGRLSAGEHRWVVDLFHLASGIYFYRIDAVNENGKRFTAVRKMTLMK